MVHADVLLCRRSALTLILSACLSTIVHAIPLAPQYAGTYLNGNGVNSRWVQVATDWKGTNNLFEEGIWGLDDQSAVINLQNGDAQVIQTLSQQVSQINFADQVYISTWGSTWGMAPLAPIFDNAPGENQENWATRFSGYVSIIDPGEYNFGILFDDGFRFSLIGANGDTVSLEMDGLNPRERLGFDQNLQLTSGLYAFQLDAYEHLEAGVIQLGWWKPGADFSVIPRENLFTQPVPEPSMLLLMLPGLALLGRRKLHRI